MNPVDQPPAPHGQHLPALPAPAAEPAAIASTGQAEQLGLKGNLSILFESRWMIGLVTMLVTAIAIVYALLAAPVYEANLLIHVEKDSPNASKNILSQVSSLFDTKQEAIAEMELLRSRMVIGEAVTDLRLHIDVRPKYAPLIGPWLSRRGGGLSDPGLFGHGGFVWGAEKAEVSQFDVPEDWQNREFLLTAQGAGAYRLSGGGQSAVFDGKVGVTLRWRSPRGDLALRVERLDARPGAIFQLQRLSRLAAIERIRTAMTITEQGRQSGIIAVKLQGDNPQRANRVLGEIGRAYIRQNLARKTEEAEKALSFLALQLPALKRQMESSEERYNAFRNRHGRIDMREEARLSLEQSEAARSRRSQLQQKRLELLTRFNEDHPIVRAVNRQSKQAQDDIELMQKRIKSLPALEQDEARLLREIKVNQDLYAKLASTAQQLDLIAVGRVSNVRLIDAPIAPERPIMPNRPVIVAMAMIVGVFLGIALAFTRRALNGALDEPGTIERLLGTRFVYASIARSKVERRLSRKARRSGGIRALLAQAAPDDVAMESLRVFHAALQNAMPHFRNNIMMVAGPSRDLGKSFVAANLAAVLGASGKRVLLIDADLRNGSLQRYFGVARAPGLTELIAGTHGLEGTIHRGVLDQVDFIATGALPSNRSELLRHQQVGALLAALSAQYDVVLVDPAPILAVSDALVIGAHAGAVFIVARAGRSSELEIKETLKRLTQAGITPQGVLFNDLSAQLATVRQQFSPGPQAQLGCSA